MWKETLASVSETFGWEVALQTQPQERLLGSHLPSLMKQTSIPHLQEGGRAHRQVWKGGLEWRSFSTLFSKATVEGTSLPPACLAWDFPRLAGSRQKTPHTRLQARAS